MSGLDDLALQHGTDKASYGHNYVAIYDPLFTPFRDEAINFLEIGIRFCKSLKMWRDWFPNATIYGVDIRQKWVNKYQSEERMVLECVDQSDAQQLTEYAKKGPWKVIVDDGSHHSQDQILTFGILWDQVEPGGYYIIEDVHTSYYHNQRGATFVNRMLRLTKEVSGAPYERGEYNNLLVRKNNEALTPHQRDVEYIQFRMGLIIIKKRGESSDYGKP